MSSNPTLVEKKLLHYTGKAIADFTMIQRKDRVMVCLSGGKDSFTMLTILDKLRRRSGNKFELFAFTLDQAQPGWDDSVLRQWLADRSIPHEILTRDTYSIVKEKVHEGKTYCSLCGSQETEPVEMSYAFKLLIDEIDEFDESDLIGSINIFAYN